jgi:hypothetical protein
VTSTTLTTAWRAVMDASVKEQNAAAANSELQVRSQRARAGLTDQHDSALAELDTALKALAAELAKASKKGK